ncbi:MAG TPA: hypothetical protein VEA44_03385 [Caulobacter sp.]|nr:hypothetical protein [Caulobacter sp.]
MSAFAAVLVFHVAVGTVASLTGFAALLSRKGARLHREAGAVWVGAMTILAASIVILGLLISSPGDLIAGLFVFYLAGSGWLAVWRAPNTFGWPERAAVLIPLATAALSILGAAALMTAPGGLPPDLPPGQRPQVGLTVAAIALLAAGLDVRVMLKGGLAGPARVSRHLWRLCLALFMATGSFGAQVPVMLKRIDVGSPPLLVIFGPAILVLVLLAFWMVRVRIGRWAWQA